MSKHQLESTNRHSVYERAPCHEQDRDAEQRARDPRPEDFVPVDGEVKDPFILEFLGLKDEYSESGARSGADRRTGGLAP